MGPTPAEEIIPHIITLPLQFSWCIEEISVLYFYILQTSYHQILNKLNLDSSLKWTIFHCSSVHTICSVAKSRWTFWFFFAIKGLRHGIWATNFSLFNLRETVFLEIGFPVCSQNAWEIDIAVLKQSFKRHFNNHLILPFGSHRRPASSRFWFKYHQLKIYWLHDKRCFLKLVLCQQFQNMIGGVFVV